jgi:hypothetical protein
MYKIKTYGRSKALTVLTTKSMNFWNVMTFTLIEVNQHFRGMYCLHPQGKRESHTSKHSEPFMEESGMNIG